MIRRHPSVIAFGILFLFNFLGFALLAQNAQNDRERATEYGIALCQASYDSRQAVIRFVNRQTEPQQAPPGSTAEQAERVRLSNERRAAARKEALEAFAPPPCIEKLGLQATPSGELVPK